MMTDKEQLIADAIKLGINYGADARDSLWSVVGVVSPGATNKAKVAAERLMERLEKLIKQESKRVEAERDQLRAELEKVRVPEGWVLVPVKPTEKMVEVGYAAINRKATSPTRLAWNAMLSAAPTPPHADQKGQ